MGLLRDEDIAHLMEHDPPVIEPPVVGEMFSRASLVQPSSLDITIGNVYVPGTKANQLGAKGSPRSSYSLKAGETAVVESAQVIHLPVDVAAVGFPPARISTRGILMTNPGHIDPGYQGRVSLTVINMGRDAFQLEEDDLLLTLLLFRLEQPPRAPFEARYGEPRLDVVKAETLDQLSKDFLQIEERAKRIAAGEEGRTRRWAVSVPALIAVVTLLGAFLQNNWGAQSQIDDLEKEVAVLRERLGGKDLEQRLEQLETRLPGSSLPSPSPSGTP